MKEIDPLGARLAIQNAQFALQKKQTVEARRLAMEAAQLDPNFEDPWLIMASLSSPKASVAYLQRALEINPRSERAAKGMQWALDRLSKVQAREAADHSRSQIPVSTPEAEETAPGETQPQTAGLEAFELPEEPQGEPVEEQKTAPPPPLPVQTIGDFETDADMYDRFRQSKDYLGDEYPPDEDKLKPGKKAKQKPAKTAKKKTSGTNLAAILLIAFFIILALIIVWFALPAWAALANSSSTALPADILEKPSLTPTVTFTPTPTATATPTPTPTFTPTPLPTNTPLPTETPVPTSTPWPTNTTAPYVAPTISSNSSSSTGDTSGRWIDVDLTHQMLYAYEGDTVVASFLVSTGVVAHPTVTGQYHIYVKYVSTLMTGPGYYLPNVPYTMYFYQGYGIHGTYWHHNFGTPMSHGCVNMETSDAEWMFNWASIGTLVNIHY